MSLGAGIGIVGVWAAVIASMFAPQVTGMGLFIVLVAAVIATAIIVRGF